MPAYTRAISRPIVDSCMATAKTASMEATAPSMPSPAENHVLKFSREPTMTEEPADRIINPIMVLNVPLMHWLTDLRCRTRPIKATRPSTIDALIRILSMIKSKILMKITHNSLLFLS